MSIDDAIRRIDILIQEYENFIKQLLGEVGSMLVDAVSRRVEKTGINAKGTKFSSYSTKSSLVGGQNWLGDGKANTFFENAQFVTLKKGDSIRRLGVLEGGYKEFRTLNGLQTNHKDFSFTRTMWLAFTFKINIEKGSVILYFDSTEATKKAQGNSDREGISIIMPSQQEIDDATIYMKDEIKNYLKRLKAA